MTAARGRRMIARPPAHGRNVGGAIMALIFNEDTVAAAPAGRGARRQRLLTTARVPATAILLDRMALDAGAEMPLAVPAGSVAWLQGVDGGVTLTHAGGEAVLSGANVAMLPPRFAGTLRAARGAALLKGEMIIYPPGTAAANHHHEGAEHFMYVLRGRGTVYAIEKPFAVRAGDVIYYPDRERHFLEAAKDDELVFAEFFAPAEFRTIWVDESQVCTWLPTGRDIEGRVPLREIAAHSSAQVASPLDV